MTTFEFESRNDTNSNKKQSKLYAGKHEADGDCIWWEDVRERKGREQGNIPVLRRQCLPRGNSTRTSKLVLLRQAADADTVNNQVKMLSILRKARLKDKEMRILMLWVFKDTRE